jgi:hypothetical protein
LKRFRKFAKPAAIAVVGIAAYRAGRRRGFRELDDSLLDLPIHAARLAERWGKAITDISEALRDESLTPEGRIARARVVIASLGPDGDIEEEDVPAAHPGAPIIPPRDGQLYAVDGDLGPRQVH